MFRIRKSRPLSDFFRRAAQKGFRMASCMRENFRNMGSCVREAPPESERTAEHLRHMSSLLDSVATGIISLDGEGRVRIFNTAAEMLFSVSAAEVMGRQFGEAGRIVSDEDHALRAFWERLSDAVWAAGAALDLEYDLVLRRGQRKVISYSVYPLGRTAWSVDKGVVIVLEDITRKKEMEDQISEARKRLQTVFDGITDGILVVDAEFRVTAVNKSMTALFHRNIRLGIRCSDGCVFGAMVGVDCPSEETFRTGLPASITKRLPARPCLSDRQAAGGPPRSSQKEADDRRRIVEISTFPLMDRANRVVQVVEYVQDITEKVDVAERLEHARRLAELGEMAARVAHEVRNPLNAITGAAHYLALEYQDDETIQKFTDLIKRQSIRVNQVASDLLHASKPMRLNRTNVSVNAVLGQLLGSLRELMLRQGVVLENDFAPDIPLIHADELQIEQALHNIVRNAVEAMPGGGALRVATGSGREDGWVEISVQDTGPGIPREDRDKIFESFFSTKPNGTGLGLSIVKGVLKNHGGEIFVEQPEEGGTRVVVCLPVRTAGSKTRLCCERAQLLSVKAVPPSEMPIPRRGVVKK